MFKLSTINSSIEVSSKGPLLALGICFLSWKCIVTLCGGLHHVDHVEMFFRFWPFLSVPCKLFGRPVDSTRTLQCLVIQMHNPVMYGQRQSMLEFHILCAFFLGSAKYANK